MQVTLPLLEASIREVDLRPIFRYRHSYPTAIDLIASGKVGFRELRQPLRLLLYTAPVAS